MSFIPQLRLPGVLSPTPPPQSIASGESRAPSAMPSLPSPSPEPIARSPFVMNLALLVLSEGESTSSSESSPIQAISHDVDRVQSIDPLKTYLLQKKRGIRRIFGKRLGKGASGDVYELVHAEARFSKFGKGPVIYIPTLDKTSEVIKCFFGNNHMKLNGDEILRGPLLALKVPHHKNLVLPTRLYVQGPCKKIRTIIRESIQQLDSKDQLIAEVAPYFRGKTLSDSSIAKEEIPQIALQIISGLQHLEKHRVIHRDIKPDNILIDEKGVVKLIDWGIAVHADLSPSTPIGTMKHQAPETFRSRRLQTAQVDAFSLGSTLYELYFGRVRPRVTCEVEAIFYKPEQDVNLEGEDPMIRLIKGLLNLDPAERTTLTDAKVMLLNMRR